MPRHEMRIPDLGLPGQPIKITAWLVRRGSWVERGEPVLEVAAGSAVVDLPAPVSGVLVEQHVAEDDLVSPSSPVAIIDTDRFA